MSQAQQAPTPKQLPILGHSLAFARDPFDAMERWAELGEVVRLDFPTRSQFMVTEPTLIRQVLVENQAAFTLGQRQRETFEGIEDNGVTATTGERWQRLRKSLQPAFTWDAIRTYGDRMAERTADHVDRWETGDQLDLLQEMRLLLDLLQEKWHAD